MFRPVIVVALVAVAVYTLSRPDLGEETALRFAGRRHLVAAGGAGLGIGFYDGILGPGTGSFLVFALVGLMGYAFLEASAKAKIVNFATNLGALLVFVPQGARAVGPRAWRWGWRNLLGGYLGARTAISRGSRFVRVFFLVVVGALVLRLGWQVVTGCAGARRAVRTGPVTPGKSGSAPHVRAVSAAATTWSAASTRQSPVVAATSAPAAPATSSSSPRARAAAAAASTGRSTT